MHEPKRVVKDSAASRKSLVATALSLAASIGTSTNDFGKVSSQVLPGGMTGAGMIASNQLIVVAEIEENSRKRRGWQGGLRGGEFRSGGNLPSMKLARTCTASTAGTQGLVFSVYTTCVRISTGAYTACSGRHHVQGQRRSHSGFSPAKTAGCLNLMDEI